MKKFGKILMYVISAAAVAGSVLLILKKFVFKDDAKDEFDEFDDEMNDFENEEETADTREYVSIKITPSEEAPAEETVVEEANAEEA